MEASKSCIAAALLILFLLARPVPCISRGRGLQSLEPEVYEIDYRGPETHSYLPPPNRFAAGRYGIRHQKAASQHNSKDPSRVAKSGGKGERTRHG